jgi:gliding motility-associated-like protein
VSIDAATGLITGIGPANGIYVVTVCVDEIRNGRVIATQRKDLQINVTECSIAAASLQSEYMMCGATRTASITNLSTSPLIISNDWTVFNPSGVSIFTMTGTTLNYTFAGNGVYKVKLVVNRGQQCADSVTTNVLVFPGLVPDFDFSGICVNRLTTFTDRTTNQLGSVNSWKWDFGESFSTEAVSTQQNTSYTYLASGDKNVRLIVTTTDGCRDTVMKIVPIVNKPPLGLAFKDTLICVNDVLQLSANGDGNFTWSPGLDIINANSASPVVSPAVTTMYYADMDADGCTNRDSVLVRVVDRVTLLPMADTVICSNDTIQLRINSDGLRYTWTPASQVLEPTFPSPFVITPTTTNYEVQAVIGGCSATARVNVRTVPYPMAYAGLDTLICYDTRAVLQGITDGSSSQWSPASSLTSASALSTVAAPSVSTHYVFTAYDTKGCPKPGSDSIYVRVLPDIDASVTADTSIIIGQPLQMSASEGYSYHWSPANYLSGKDISNPIATITEPFDNFRYKIKIANEAGCADSAFMNIKVFATRPSVFVPTAFTPNNDGRNDVLRPIAAGMQRIEHFNIYNRWGQLIFSTRQNGHGWDGNINGQPQATNTYIWMVKAIDYTGSSYFQKGTVTLIR